MLHQETSHVTLKVLQHCDLIVYLSTESLSVMHECDVTSFLGRSLSCRGACHPVWVFFFLFELAQAPSRLLKTAHKLKSLAQPPDDEGPSSSSGE